MEALWPSPVLTCKMFVEAVSIHRSFFPAQRDEKIVKVGVISTFKREKFQFDVICWQMNCLYIVLFSYLFL